MDWSLFRSWRERRLEQRGLVDGQSIQRPAPSCAALAESDWRVRLAAVKALARSRDPAEPSLLVQFLHDAHLTVRRAAAAGLKHLHRAAIRPLLEELTRGFQSTSLRQASHHVLHELYMNGDLPDREVESYPILEQFYCGIPAAQAANLALLVRANRPEPLV